MLPTDREAVAAEGAALPAGALRLHLARRLGLQYRWVVWLAISLGAFFQNFQLFSFAVLVPSLLAELGLSYAVAGTLSSAYTLASIVVMAPLGAAGDRLGWRPLLIAGMLAMSAGSFVFAAAQSYVWAMLGRVLLGLGASVIMVMPPALLASWFGKSQYRSVLGLHISLGKTGSILATWLLPSLIVAFGWRLGFAAVSVIGPLAFLAAFLVANQPSEVGLRGRDSFAVPRASRGAERLAPPPSLLEVARDRNIWLLAFSQGMLFIAYLGTVNWIPTYLKVVTGASEVEGGFQAGFILWGTIVGFALSGYAVNWLGRARPLYSAALLGTTVMTALIAASLLPALPTWLWPPFMFVYGLFLSMMVLINLLVASLVSPRAIGASMGLVFTISFIGQMAGPPLVGAVADRTGLLTNGFWLAAGCALLGFCTSLLIKEGTAHLAGE
ncbi:MAG: MFS transporter [Chloroflexota bacterium]